MNGDGFADIIIGADRADPAGTDSGSSYVVFGKAGGVLVAGPASALNGANGFRLDGVATFDRHRPQRRRGRRRQRRRLRQM